MFKRAVDRELDRTAAIGRDYLNGTTLRRSESLGMLAKAAGVPLCSDCNEPVTIDKKKFLTAKPGKCNYCLAQDRRLNW